MQPFHCMPLCPGRVKGGMGAALLQTPDVAMDILKTLTRNITCPVTCKIRLLETLEEVRISSGCAAGAFQPTCFLVQFAMASARRKRPQAVAHAKKDLPPACPLKTSQLQCFTGCAVLVQTVDFARKCESTGIAAIAVHARVW